jgi:hypothetical protein
MGRCPTPISHGGSQGFKSPHLHPKHCRSERRQLRAGGAHRMLRPRCGRKLKSQSSREALRDARGLGLGRTMTTQRGHRQPPTDGRSSPASRLSRSATGRPGPLPNHRPRDDPSPSRSAAGPARPVPASRARLQPRQTTRRRGHGGRPRRPRPSQPCGCRPHRHARDLIPVGHNGRRGPDTGHLDAQTPAADTGHLDRPRGPPDARTGHRTPDAGQKRGHGHDSAAGVRTSRVAMPSDHALRRPTVFALSHYQPAPRPLRRPSGAPAHCCPRTITGRA